MKISKSNRCNQLPWDHFYHLVYHFNVSLCPCLYHIKKYLTHIPLTYSITFLINVNYTILCRICIILLSILLFTKYLKVQFHIKICLNMILWLHILLCMPKVFQYWSTNLLRWILDQIAGYSLFKFLLHSQTHSEIRLAHTLISH